MSRLWFDLCCMSLGRKSLISDLYVDDIPGCWPLSAISKLTPTLLREYTSRIPCR